MILFKKSLENEISLRDLQSSNIDLISSISVEIIAVEFTSSNLEQPLNISLAF